jgi:hypothetical protein
MSAMSTSKYTYIYINIQDKEHCEEYGRMLEADPTKVKVHIHICIYVYLHLQASKVSPVILYISYYHHTYIQQRLVRELRREGFLN